MAVSKKIRGCTRYEPESRPDRVRRPDHRRYCCAAPCFKEDARPKDRPALHGNFDSLLPEQKRQLIQALINDPDNTLFSITGFGADLALIRAEREKGRATAKKWREAMAKAETYTPLYIETYWELATVMHAVALARADIEQQLNHIAQADSQIHQALKGAKTQQQRDHLEEQHRGLFSRLTNLRAQRDELDRFEEDVVRSAAQDMTTIPLPSDSKLKRI